jgi:hypothetical protein
VLAQSQLIDVHLFIQRLQHPAPIQGAATVSAAPIVTATTFPIATSQFAVVKDVELGKVLVHEQWMKMLRIYYTGVRSEFSALRR